MSSQFEQDSASILTKQGFGGMDSVNNRFSEKSFNFIEGTVQEYLNDGVGTIKVAMSGTKYGQYPETATPLNSHMRTYPMKGERILLYASQTKMYYLSAINLFDNIRGNIVNIPISDMNTDPLVGPNDGIYSNKGQTPISPNTNSEDAINYITQTDSDLVPFHEGDIVMHGRYDNYIRLGKAISSDSAIIEIGISKTKQQSYITTNRYGDNSTIVISEDGVMDFNFSGRMFPTSVNFPQKLSGHQIGLFSNRVIINADEEEFIAMSKKNMFLSTDGDLVIRCKNLRVISDTSTLDSSTIKLGGDGAIQGLVNGEDLKLILSKLISLLISSKVITNTGASTGGFVENAKYVDLLKEIDTVISTTIYG